MTYELRTVSTEVDHNHRRDRLTTERSKIDSAILSADYTAKATFSTLDEARKACVKCSHSIYPMKSMSEWVLNVDTAYIAVLDDDGEDTGDYDSAGQLEIPETWDDTSDDEDEE